MLFTFRPQWISHNNLCFRDNTKNNTFSFMAKRENLRHVDCINLLALPNLLFLALVCAI